jgi:hypothetical protein
MRPLNVRQGAWAGIAVAMVGAFAAAARSATPLLAFIETAAVGLLAVVLVIGVALGSIAAVPGLRKLESGARSRFGAPPSWAVLSAPCSRP